MTEEVMVGRRKRIGTWADPNKKEGEGVLLQKVQKPLLKY